MHQIKLQIMTSFTSSNNNLKNKNIANNKRNNNYNTTAIFFFFFFLPIASVISIFTLCKIAYKFPDSKCCTSQIPLPWLPPFQVLSLPYPLSNMHIKAHTQITYLGYYKSPNDFLILWGRQKYCKIFRVCQNGKNLGRFTKIHSKYLFSYFYLATPIRIPAI